jgi:hypothetical protein
MPACRGLFTPAHSDPGRRREKRCYGTSEQAGNNEEMTDNPLKLVLDHLKALSSEVGGLRSEMGGRMDALGRQIGSLNESYLLVNASSMFGNEYARQLLARTGQDLLRQFPRSTIASDNEERALAIVEHSKRAMRVLIQQDVPRQLLLRIFQALQVRSTMKCVEPVRLYAVAVSALGFAGLFWLVWSKTWQVEP